MRGHSALAGWLGNHLPFLLPGLQNRQAFFKFLSGRLQFAFQHGLSGFQAFDRIFFFTNLPEKGSKVWMYLEEVIIEV